MLSETDLSLVNALQVDPRAPWSLVGRALGTGPVTAARRWETLVGNGESWMVAYPSGSLAARLVVAFVEIGCAPGRAVGVGKMLAADPHIATVEYLAGPCDLLVHVVAPSLREVSDYIVHRLAPLRGVTGTRTLVSARLFSEGSRWRVRAISPDQRNALAGRRKPPGTGTRFDELDRKVLRVLGENGRAAYAEIADRVGASPSTVRRRVDAALAAGLIRLRCEIARSLSPAPVTMMLWLRVPPDRLESTARSVSTLPEVRMCAAINGSANLLVVVWVRAPGEWVTLESALVTKLPWVEIVERAVTLRTIKLMGRLLDDSGLARSQIPLDFWSAVEPRTTTDHG